MKSKKIAALTGVCIILASISLGYCYYMYAVRSVHKIDCDCGTWDISKSDSVYNYLNYKIITHIFSACKGMNDTELENLSSSILGTLKDNIEIDDSFTRDDFSAEYSEEPKDNCTNINIEDLNIPSEYLSNLNYKYVNIIKKG